MKSRSEETKQNQKKRNAYSHKEEARADVVRHRTHPDVPVFLQVFGCDHCQHRNTISSCVLAEKQDLTKHKGTDVVDASFFSPFL